MIGSLMEVFSILVNFSYIYKKLKPPLVYTEEKKRRILLKQIIQIKLPT